MQLAVRSYLATGVAIASVSAVAISPVAPSMPDVQVPAVYSSAVELSALVNPLAEYAIVFNRALQNVAALAERMAENPAPILSQIVSNQLNGAAGIATFIGVFGEAVVTQLVAMPGELKTAVGELAAGNVTQALNTVLAALLAPIMSPVIDVLLLNPDVYIGLQEALTQPLKNVLNVIDLTSVPNVYNLLGPLLAPVQLLTDVTNAIGAAGDAIVAGIRTGDLEQIANALLMVGPAVTDAILNGSPLGGEYAAGLLGPQGIFAGLLTIRDLIADAITPPLRVRSLAVADSTVETGARTLTLDVAPEVTETVGVEPVSNSDAPAVTETDTEAVAAEPAAAAPEESVVPVTDVTPVADAVETETPAAEDDADGKVETPGVKARNNVRSVRGGSDAAANGRGQHAKSAKSERSKDSSGSSDTSSGSDSDSGSAGSGE